MTSLPSSPSSVSRPARPHITSSRVVPFRTSSAAVPVIVHSTRAPATLAHRPCANAGPTIRPTVPTVTKIVRSLMRSPSLLAVDVRVARVDHAGVGVRAAVHGVVPGDVVATLEEIVAGLAAGVRAVDPQAVVALTAVDAVVLVVALNPVVVGLATDHVGAIIALALVVPLAEAEDVVALERLHVVGACPRADDVVAGGAVDAVVGGRSDDRALLRGASHAGDEAVRERRTHHEAHGRDGNEDRTKPHQSPPDSSSAAAYRMGGAPSRRWARLLSWPCAPVAQVDRAAAF